MTVSVPYVFYNQSGRVPASELDANFAALAVAINAGPDATPYSAVAIGADGTTYTAENIVSPKAWVIRDIFQTPSASTISILFEVIPTPTPTTVSLRVHGGLNGVTRGIHPADSKQVATEVPWTLTATADPFTFILAGSTWVAGSVVWKGGAVAYVPGSLVDCAAKLNAMADWMRDHAPATAYLPLGGMYIQTDMILWPEGCTILGHGGRRTFFFLADAADMAPVNSVHHMMGTGNASGTKYGNVTDTTWRGFTLFGCRQHNRYGAGDHSIDLGSDSDATNRPMNIWLDDITNIGSAGYGCSWGGHNSKWLCKVTNYEGAFSDGDGFDCKNRNDDNFVVNYFAPNLAWHAMGTQGTNLQPVITLGANPVTITTTTASASQFTIARSIDSACQPGEIATFTGPTFNGINLTGSFHVVALAGSVSGGTITFDSGQTASGTGTGGGSGMTFVCPHISTGDVAIDGRGIGTNIYGGSWTGECFGRNVFRGRGGAAGQGNGLGASYMNIIGVVGIDLTPSWVATTTNTGNFLQLNGIGQKAVGWSFQTSGGASGAVLAATSNGCVLADFYIKGSATALDLRGDRFKVHDFIVEDYTVLGASLDGTQVSVSTVLGSNPFTPNAIGSGVVIVAAPAHGQAGPTFTVSFSGALNGPNGIVIAPSNVASYTATVIDVNSYSIVATGSATNTDAFGGDEVIANYGNTAHIADDMEISSGTFHLTGARTVGSGEITLTTHCTGAKIQNCHFSSDNSDACVITDNGISTIWGPGNSGGIWNAQSVYALPTSGSVTLVAGDSGKILLLPSNAASTVTVTLPNNSATNVLPPGWFIDVVCNNANGVALTTVAGTIGDGNNSSSNPGSLTSSTNGASGRLVWRSTSGYRFINKEGTWTLA